MRSVLFRLCSIFFGLLSLPAAQAGEPFECSSNAKASDYQPGHIVRWCEVTRDARRMGTTGEVHALLKVDVQSGTTHCQFGYHPRRQVV